MKLQRIKKTKSIAFDLPKIHYECFSVQTIVYSAKNDFLLYIKLLHTCEKYNFKFYNIFQIYISLLKIFFKYLSNYKFGEIEKFDYSIAQKYNYKI